MYRCNSLRGYICSHANICQSLLTTSFTRGFRSVSFIQHGQALLNPAPSRPRPSPSMPPINPNRPQTPNLRHVRHLQRARRHAILHPPPPPLRPIQHNRNGSDNKLLAKLNHDPRGNPKTHNRLRSSRREPEQTLRRRLPLGRISILDRQIRTSRVRYCGNWQAALVWRGAVDRGSGWDGGRCYPALSGVGRDERAGGSSGSRAEFEDRVRSGEVVCEGPRVCHF